MGHVEDVVFGMEEDTVSDVVEVDNGLFIFRLIAKEEGEELPLAEVKDKIRERVFQDKFKKDFKEWVQELRKEAYVELK